MGSIVAAVVTMKVDFELVLVRKICMKGVNGAFGVVKLLGLTWQVYASYLL